MDSSSADWALGQNWTAARILMISVLDHVIFTYYFAFCVLCINYSKHEHGKEHILWDTSIYTVQGSSNIISGFYIRPPVCLTDVKTVEDKTHSLCFRERSQGCSRYFFKVSWRRGLENQCAGSWISPGWCRGCAAHQVTNSHRAQMNNTELLWENESSSNHAQHRPVMAARRESLERSISGLRGFQQWERKGDVVWVKWRSEEWGKDSAATTCFCTKGGNQRWWLF